MKTSTYKFVSDDGTAIHTYRWQPDDPPVKGIVHIAHGLAEHGIRYRHVAESLTSNGYAVFCHDHRGHGQTAASPEALGHFADAGGWDRAVKDLQLLMSAERQENPGLPMFLLGHSMGSFMAQQLLYENSNLMEGCILSGSNGDPIRLVIVLDALARLQRFFYGRRARSRLLHRLSLRRANQAFRPVRTSFDWLTRDSAVVEAYVGDPLCGFVGTTQLWIDLVHGARVIARPENRARIPKQLPIYIIAGTADPVSDGCKGLEQLIRSYRSAGLTDVRHKFYPGGRHELLNEINREEVMSDLVAWLDSTAVQVRHR